MTDKGGKALEEGGKALQKKNRVNPIPGMPRFKGRCFIR